MIWPGGKLYIFLRSYKFKPFVTMKQRNFLCMLMCLMLHTQVLPIYGQMYDFYYEDMYFTIMNGGAGDEVALIRIDDRSRIDVPSSVTYEGRTYEVTRLASGCLRCNSVEYIHIPSSIKEIAGNVAAGTHRLKSIVVDPNNEHYDSRENCNAIIETSTNTLICGCSTTTFPSTVKSIGDSAFGSSNISNVVLPETITQLGQYAFSTCRQLNSIKILGDVKIVPQGFCDGAYLTEVVLPPALEEIGAYAFSRAHGDILPHVSIRVLRIPSSVKKIGSYAFRDTGIETLIMSLPKDIELENIWDWLGVGTLKTLYLLDRENGITLPPPLRFADCLTDVFNFSPVPQPLDGPYFSKRTFGLGTLYVPKGSKTLYEAAQWWNHFCFIREFDPEQVMANIDAGIVDNGDHEPVESGWYNKVMAFRLGNMGYTLSKGENGPEACFVQAKGCRGTLVVPEKITVRGVDIPVTAISYLALLDDQRIYTKVRGIEIPKTVKQINDIPFDGVFMDIVDWTCVNPMLEFVHIADDNPYLDARDGCGCIIETATNKLITATGPQSFIPYGVKSIASYAFVWKPISEIVIPASVDSVEYFAFQQSTVEIRGTPALAELAFRGCIDVYSYSRHPKPATGAFEPLTSDYTFYIPIGTKETYLATPGWRTFRNHIVETNLVDGIEDIEPSQTDNGKPSSHQFFDLTGRRLAAPPARGLYIEDGKVKGK